MKIMDIQYIEKELEDNFKVRYFKKISSTNDYAKDNKVESGTLILADAQTRGRGKDERVWHTGDGLNIAMTIYTEPNCNIDKLEGLTVLIAEKIKGAVKELYNLELVIKLPNDLLLNNKKICGILTETIVEKEIVKKLIVGIGFNVNQDKLNDEIKETATSLKIETGKEFKREEIIVGICKKLDEMMQKRNEYCDS